MYTSTINVVFAGKPIEDGDEASVPYVPPDAVSKEKWIKLKYDYSPTFNSKPYRQYKFFQVHSYSIKTKDMNKIIVDL